MSRVANANPVNSQSWIALTGSIIDSRVLVAIEASRIAQAKPIEVVLRHAGHEELHHIAAICNSDFGLAVTRRDYAVEGRGDDGIDGDCVAEHGLDESGDGGRITVVEVHRYWELCVGGSGCEWNFEIGAVRVGDCKGSTKEGAKSEDCGAQHGP